MRDPTWQTPDGSVRLFLGDALTLLPELNADCVVTDPPYGMKKAAWDQAIPDWLAMVKGTPTACFCGVIGMRDYPPADWTGAWVRLGSTQRNGRLRGFNNWEPILFYGIDALANDVISTPNYHEDHGHPTEKPERLMQRLVNLMPAGTVCDPFMGSGTTIIAAIRAGRHAIGIDNDPDYFQIAVRRIEAELARHPLLEPKEPAETQLSLLGE